MVRQCESAHCSAADAEINEVCKGEGWPVNHPVLTRDSQGICTCSCSCLAFGTPVQISDGSYQAIESLEVGDSVLACDINLDWQAREVIFSAGTTGVSNQKYTVLITYENKAMAVTSDHIFFMADRLLKRADRLTAGDMLLRSDGNPVRVHSVHIGDYTAGFHHIATSKDAPTSDLTGHLINTNGVISADYTLQLYASRGHRFAQFVENHDAALVVGSPEYVEKYGSDCLEAPKSIRSGTVGPLLRVATNSARDVESGTFIAANLTRISIPDGACSFISEDDAAEKLKDPRRPWNDPQAREWTEALIKHHRAFYPNVTFHFDWMDNTVNAYAWVSNGVRHIAILGGLVRHFALEMEGIALVIAHELAHHYAGAPTFPGGLSCEGESDYYGVLGIMRNAWFGEFYMTVTDRAVPQMANFFGVPNSPTVPGGNSACQHPAGACRIATYHAAVGLRKKPACAN